MADPTRRPLFLCMAYEEEAKLDALSPQAWEALRAETLAYVAELEAGGHLVKTHALKSARAAVTVRVRQGRVSTTDGPFAETKEQLGGFFLVEATDINEAIRLAADWPSARLGSIEVRPVEPELKVVGRYSPLQ